MLCLLLAPLLLCSLQHVGSLRCYTCWFPSISPTDCMQYVQECPAGQRCLSSTAIGSKEAVHLMLFEKSCAIASQCGLSGEKHAAGLNFTFTTKCCDVDLCNAAGAAPGVPPGTILSLLLLLLTLCW